MATFEEEIAALEQVASDLGNALTIAEVSVRAGLVGAVQYRDRVYAILGMRAPNGCGCTLRVANPAIGASIRALGGKAASIAKTTVAKTVKTLAKSPKLVFASIAGFAVWDWMVPSEAAEVQQVLTEGDVMAGQLNRLPPGEALKYLKEVGAVYGDADSGPSLTTWLVIGGVGVLVLPWVLRRLQAALP